MSTNYRLTQYQEGSLRELWTLSLPLIFSFLSSNLMIFIDRLILARYSTQALNAAAAAGIVWGVFQLGTIATASIAESFVGQYNGSKKYSLVGRPVWQMIWFSLMTCLLFIPLAFFTGKWFLPSYHYHDLTLPYYQWILFLGFFFPLTASISSFFIGIGKVRLVFWVSIFSNILNIILDYLLIFGVEGWIPSMATKGAAIATGISEGIHALILFIIFLSRNHRQTYHTYKWGFKKSLFWRCLKTGAPSSAGHMIEMIAWSIATYMLASLGEIYLSIGVIGQTIYLFFAFGMEGLQKGLIATTSNFIGAGKWDLVTKSWTSGLKILTIISLLISFCLIIYPDPLIELFLTHHHVQISNILTSYLRWTFFWVWVYFFFDGIVWLTAGALIAAGDTFFIMWMNALSSWLFALLPIYIFIFKLQIAPMYYWMLIVIYGGANMIFFIARFKQKKWKNLSLT